MDFEEIMNIFQYNGVSQDAVYIRAFLFTLKDDVKQWLRRFPQGSIITWEEITRKFLDKYLFLAKTGKFRREIHNFCQKDNETDFWDGLTPASRRTLGNRAGGPLMNKTPEEIVTNQWPSESTERRRANDVHLVDANTSVQVQPDAMAKAIRKLTLASIQNETHAACDIFGRGHPTHECQASTEEVNVAGNYNFNAKGQRHPGFHGAHLGIQQMHGNKITPDLRDKGGQVLEEPTPVQKESVPEKEIGEQLKNEVDKKKKGKKGADKKKKEDISSRDESNEESKHIHALSFPQNLYREKLAKQFERKLECEIGEIRSIPLYLQLADQTTLIPEGIVEDVLVRVDKFVFPMDFIVVNMEENKKVPLILGRRFLATGREILDIHDRKLMLRVREETVTFEMNVEMEV
ncbi:uncharacterized protein [Nicotiana tomentosiformis]|uniref:uncharacterized protein n=1 Tax=Nicotiana tomentosiformis TaxID=4098 RepID=UPI00388CC8BF